MRPLCILIMLVIADWRWLTPNLLTTLANIFKVGAAVFILFDDWTYTVLGVILLQAGLLFDHLDGTVARYRGIGCTFGSFYDKTSDAVTWFMVVMAVGWVSFSRSGDGLMLVLPAVSAYALLTLGYMKWLVETEVERAKWIEAVDDPQAAVDRALKKNPPALPPERDAAAWAKWFFVRVYRIVLFEEVDLYLWVGAMVLLGYHKWLMWGLAITQTLGLVYMIFKRGAVLRRVDERRRARASS